MFFDLCRDLILEIHSFVHPVPSARAGVKTSVCPRVLFSSPYV